MKKRSTTNAAQFLLVFAGLGGCSAPSQSSDPSFQVSLGFGTTPVGHEELTRIGVEIANATGDVFYPAVVFQEAGSKSDNPVIQGNVSTDFPKTFDTVPLPKYWQLSSTDNWHDSGFGQRLHFLREHSNGVAESMADSCKKSVKAITTIVDDVLGNWAIDNQEPALFLIGHATHIIQDSFSKAHTTRDPFSLYRKIDDICTWGAEIAGVCHHSHGGAVTEDFIYYPNSIPFMGSAECRDDFESCLKPEAAMAAKVTGGFLLKVKELISKGYSELSGAAKGSLESWFQSSKGGVHAGYFDCDI